MEKVLLSKVWNINDIREILEEAGNKMQLQCTNVPIRISGRMTTCKGAFIYKFVNKNIMPVEFVFSNNLINGNYDKKIVIQVIKHEYAHFYTIIKNNKDYGHNDCFKMNCMRLGISMDTYFMGKPIDASLVPKRNKKYIITCTNCGATTERERFTKGINHFTSHYKCGKCRGILKVTKIK